MKKTLLIAAAALAAGVISSQAQAVYSQNIVGYVNTPVPNGFSAIANPLNASDSNGVNNYITNVIAVFSGNYDGSLVYYWNGHGYTTYTIDSSWPTGLGNAADSAAVAPTPLPPGTGIFINNNTGVAQINTFVGTVAVGGSGASTNVVGIATNVIVTGYSYISSVIPVGGGLSSVDQLPLNGSLDGSIIYFPNIVAGAVHGYNEVTVDSSWSTGYGNAADSAQVAEPVLPVGVGFLINNNTGAAVPWVQSY